MESLMFTQLRQYLLVVGFFIVMATAMPVDEEVKKYLQTYQYIGETSPDPDMKVSEIREGPELSGAIRNFQRMAGLRETGVADRETIEMMHKPRCGFPDVISPSQNYNKRNKRYALLGSAKWQKQDLTYRILNYSPKISQSETEHWIHKAFETWSSVTPLRFYQISSGEADIFIKFGRYYHEDAYPFDGPGGTLAHAFGPSAGIGGDVHFDDDEHWTVRLPRDGNDLYTVAVHELGHSLGLAHSNAQDAIMRPFYDFSEKVGYYALSRDDIAGIQYLYGHDDKRVTIPPRTPRPTPRPTIAQPKTTQAVATRPPIPVPEHCGRDVHFDAIVSTSSGKTYAFEGWMYVYIWEGNVLDMSTPKLVSDVFYELHWGVDAAFSIKENGREVIYIMKAWFVWIYDANTLQPIRQLVPRGELFLELPNSPCGAFKSHYDNHVYVFQGGSYWRLEGDQNGVFSRKMSPGYPRPISDWSLPVRKIDAVMSWQGDIYFFEGNDYYKFDTYTNTIVGGYPREVSVWWLGCPDVVRKWPMVGEVREGSGSSSTSPLSLLSLIFATAFSLLHNRI